MAETPVMIVPLDWPQEILALQRRLYDLPWLSGLRADDHAEPWINPKRKGRPLSDEYLRLLEDHAPYCNLPRWLELKEKDTIKPEPAHVYSFDLLTRGLLSMLCRKVSPLWSSTLICADTQIASEEMIQEFGVDLRMEYHEETNVEFNAQSHQIFLLLGCLERLEGGIVDFLTGLHEAAAPGASMMVCTLNGEHQAGFAYKTDIYTECVRRPERHLFQVTYAMRRDEAEEAFTQAGWRVEKFAYGANVAAKVESHQIPSYLNYHLIREDD